MSDVRAFWQTLPNQMKQLALKIPQRGGKRKGAGRKRKAPRPRVSHKARAQLDKPSVVLVTLRVSAGVWNLRSKRCFGAIEQCFADARERFGLRLIEFSVLANDLAPPRGLAALPRENAMAGCSGVRARGGAELEGGDIVVAWLVQPFVTTHPASLALRKRRGPSSGCPTSSPCKPSCSIPKREDAGHASLGDEAGAEVGPKLRGPA